MGPSETMEHDLLVDLVRRSSLLDALGGGTLDRKEIERRLDISKPTGYRLTGWFEELGLIAESDQRFALTAVGEVIADAVSTFRTTVRTTLRPARKERELCIDVVGLLPALVTLREEPSDRRTLERRLGVSKTTVHRFTRSLGEIGLIERSAEGYALTDAGEVLADSGSAFETNVWMSFALAPVIEATHGTPSPLDVEAFADSSVTSAGYGDPYAPLVRFTSLLEETEAVRGINVFSIAPTYMEEIQQRIVDGMRTELVAPPEVAEDIMEHYPEKCVEVCVSGYLTHWLHTALPLYGLVLFDDCVGIAVTDSGTDRVRLFVDSSSTAAREWAETVYESYQSEAVLLEAFTKTGLREALASRDPA